jgi:hypothetical protein
MRIASGFADQETIVPQSPQYTKIPSTPPYDCHRNVILISPQFAQHGVTGIVGIIVPFSI